MVKDDHEPSLPSLDQVRKGRRVLSRAQEIYQFCEGATEIGVGAADAVARSTRAKLEADTKAMYCESQRRRERPGVCMLDLLRRSAYNGGD